MAPPNGPVAVALDAYVLRHRRKLADKQQEGQYVYFQHVVARRPPRRLQVQVGRRLIFTYYSLQLRHDVRAPKRYDLYQRVEDL